MTGVKLFLLCSAFVLAGKALAGATSQASSPLDSLTAQKILSSLIEPTVDDRSSKNYEIKVLEKMRKMDLWVNDLSAGEKTRIEEVSVQCSIGMLCVPLHPLKQRETLYPSLRCSK
jgi:hypothetical protein